MAFFKKKVGDKAAAALFVRTYSEELVNNGQSLFDEIGNILLVSGVSEEEIKQKLFEEEIAQVLLALLVSQESLALFNLYGEERGQRIWKETLSLLKESTLTSQSVTDMEGIASSTRQMILANMEAGLTLPPHTVAGVLLTYAGLDGESETVFISNQKILDPVILMKIGELLMQTNIPFWKMFGQKYKLA